MIAAISPHEDSEPMASSAKQGYVGVIYFSHHQTAGRDAAAELEYSAAKTSVWWDIDNCEVPRGCDAYRIAHNIRSILLENNYRGSVAIYAYGDTSRIPSYVQQALYSTGVLLNHVPAGVKDGSDKKILVDMMLWAMDNQAPANLMLISGDRDFSYVLHQLGMKRYNILLARPEKASLPLNIAAKTVWLWTSIATGERPNIPIDSGRYHHRSLSHMVPKRAEPSKLMGSDLECGRRLSFCELCNVVCSHHDLIIHRSGRKHRVKAAIVARERPHISSLMWCGVCQIGFHSGAMYENHILGGSHLNALRLREDQYEHSQKRRRIYID